MPAAFELVAGFHTKCVHCLQWKRFFLVGCRGHTLETEQGNQRNGKRVRQKQMGTVAQNGAWRPHAAVQVEIKRGRAASKHGLSEGRQGVQPAQLQMCSCGRIGAKPVVDMRCC